MRRARGLTMVELVIAMAVFFLASTFLMGIFAFGSRLPLHAERSATTADLAQKLMDDRLSQPFYVPLTSEARAPVPGNPDYDFEVTVAPASFDSDVSLVTLTVFPEEGNSLSLRAVRPPNPVTTGESLATGTYACFSCHSASSRPDLGPGGSGPDWNSSTLAASAQAAGFGSDVEGYIRDSVRNPDSYEASGWGAVMQSYPDIVGMPDSDLDALVDFITSL